ncbi:D-aminoacyl-tRNA deacylase [Bryobacter aggregatus]|uniref:D-aminoacyl-tRNA deacylase n=1 Tax=Bryobacter aggregatus TaxID=360054 RepID=UPI0004E0D0EC|nr:D-aminoacyl-tRNA deacylase [Bryobacter aggregatus]
MRAVIQRVLEASVAVEGVQISKIGQGLLVLAAVGKEDDEKDVAVLAHKLAQLRIFHDEEGKMNRNISQAGGQMLLVSQFTLYGDARKGNRPSFDAAAEPARARELFDLLVTTIEAKSIPVCTGQFRSHMEVSLINDGPVTILVDSRRQF